MGLKDRITGKTAVFGVMGNPVAHSFSPVIQNLLGDTFGQEIAYAAFPVSEDHLGTAVAGAHALGIPGLNVTLPHKTSVIKYLFDLDDTAKRIGAVNTLKYAPEGYIGYNTDLDGIQMSFAVRDIDVSDQVVLIIGAGGAAFSAAFAMLQAGCSKLILANRHKNRAVQLAVHMNTYYNIPIETCELDQIKELSGDIVIQATSVGMSEDVSPLNSPLDIRGFKTAFDIIYTPWKTRFLEQACHLGLNCINGFDMLFFQAVRSFEIWHSLRLDKEDLWPVKEELERRFLALMKENKL